MQVLSSLIIFIGGPIQQPVYREIDTPFVPKPTRGRGGGRGRTKKVYQTHILEDEASLYFIIKNNRTLELTVCDFSYFEQSHTFQY